MANDNVVRMRFRPVGTAQRRQGVPEYSPLGTGCPAVEQAVVMACGYCRTVADQNRQENLEQLRQLGVQIEPVNREKYLALLADIYQYDAGNMLYRPDAELDQMVRSDAVKYSVS